MKTNYDPQTYPAVYVANNPAIGRFQVYWQNHTGTFILSCSTSSDVEAVEAIMLQSPAFEGGEIRLLNQEAQRVIACVKWEIDATEIGPSFFDREDVFHDWHLALIALQVREKRRDEIQNRVGMEA
jgi:glycogen synthase